MQLAITVEGSGVHVEAGKNDAFWTRFQSGVWEPDTLAVFRRYLDKCHSYIDIGAWVGPTLLQGCQLARRAFGIEPDPIAFSELKRNMQNNPDITGNVELFNICIAPHSGKVSFGSRGDGGDTMSSLLFSGGKTSWTVDGLSFADWVASAGIDDCNFIKMDIEGGEYSVLPTMREYLERLRPTVLLSLHPCFIGDLEARGVAAKLRRALFRLRATVRLLKSVGFYRHVCDPLGKVPAAGIASFRTRAHRLAAAPAWKPLVIFTMALRGMMGKPSVLLLTDRPW